MNYSRGLAAILPGMLYPSFFAKGRMKPPRQQSTCRPMSWQKAILPSPTMSSIVPWRLHIDQWRGNGEWEVLR